MSTITRTTNNLFKEIRWQTLQEMEVNGIIHAVVRIRPRLAQLMLSKNVEGNRSQKSQVIKTYGSEMLRGNWLYAGDPIRFDTTGAMIDGQHRLESIIAAAAVDPDFYVDNLVIYGLDPKAKAVIDQGSKRKPGEQLSMILNTPSAAAVAAAVKLILVREAGLEFRDNKNHESVSTPGLIVEWVETHPEDMEVINRNSTKSSKAHLSPSVTLAATVLFARIDTDAAQLFLDRLVDGTGLGHGSPILALRERALNDKLAKVRVSKRDQMGMNIKAWNYWRQGKSLKLMRMPVGGWTEANFPTLDK